MKQMNLFTVTLVFFIAASIGCGHRSAPLNTAQDEAGAVKASDKSGEGGKADDKDGASLVFCAVKGRSCQMADPQLRNPVFGRKSSCLKSGGGF
ncbi:MAG: hypothetical protein BWK80_14615 [Desulfobacteraceae bacterium IS3]|nr:MAG: hypothetical protein BWK80_14615 [Desulfobacteraceae bacterium IS3]